jgi:hypothetical protein
MVMSGVIQTPAPDVCKAFAKADVVAVVGADATDGQMLIPGTCSWSAKGANLSISRATLGTGDAGMVFEARKGSAAEGEVVFDVAGVGQRAVSTLAANKRTLTLLAVNGNDLWTFTLSKGDQPVDTDVLLPRMRDLAKKGLAGK